MRTTDSLFHRRSTSLIQTLYYQLCAVMSRFAVLHCSCKTDIRTTSLGSLMWNHDTGPIAHLFTNAESTVERNPDYGYLVITDIFLSRLGTAHTFSLNSTMLYRQPLMRTTEVFLAQHFPTLCRNLPFLFLR